MLRLKPLVVQDQQKERDILAFILSLFPNTPGASTQGLNA
jgi:hypothetical protein